MIKRCLALRSKNCRERHQDCGTLYVTFSREIEPTSLTVRKIRTYTPRMRWRIVSGLVLGLWLTLVSVELCEEMGLFDFDDPGLAQTLDGIVNSFGNAIKLQDNDNPLKMFFLAFSWGIIDTCLHQCLSFQSVMQVPNLVKANPKTFKLYHVFLI